MNNINGIKYFTHKRKGAEACGDIVYICDNEHVKIYSLADCIKSEIKSIEGAKYIQQKLAEYILDVPEKIFLDEELFKANCIAIIGEAIHVYSKYHHIGENEIASTLMMIIIWKRNNLARWIHVGDGIILTLQKNKIDILSRPQNSVSKQYTFCTTSKNLMRYMHIENFNEYEKIIMMTDGGMHYLYEDSHFTLKGEKLLIEGIESIKRYLDNQLVSDDYSMMEVVL